LESSHIKVDRTSLRVQCEQLPPADGAGRQRRCNRHTILGHCRRGTSSYSLPFGLIEAISRLTRSRSLTVDLVDDFDACAMHAFEEMLYLAVDSVLGVPVDS
jgi:hypothetical protein